jgi:hypothetical protein
MPATCASVNRIPTAAVTASKGVVALSVATVAIPLWASTAIAVPVDIEPVEIEVEAWALSLAALATPAVAEAMPLKPIASPLTVISMAVATFTTLFVPGSWSTAGPFS